MKLYLGSKSPRRQELLKGAEITYTLVDIEVDEDFPLEMPGNEVAEYLAIKKSMAFKGPLEEGVLLTADTVVYLKGKVINKPESEEDAMKMLSELSGSMHTVYTGVCLRTPTQIETFTDSTNVYFDDLTPAEIAYYVNKYNPMDKAGSYGIQDWIGYIGIRRIEGDFFNVMGLPVRRIYEQLKKMGFPLPPGRY